MSDKLKNFIAGNRSRFDSEMPSGKVWEGIENAVNGTKKKKPVLMAIIKWSMAAAAVLLIGTVIYIKTNKKEITKTDLVKNDVNDLLKDAPQVNQFAKLIDMKQEELKLLAKEQPDLYHKFSNDIIQLDSSYKALKDQLVVSPNKELLIEAMIQNLQLQLNVLNQQLNIIHQIKESKKYSHEKVFKTI